jgi:HAD superfamily hydrolase (TIGR01509 family)
MHSSSTTLIFDVEGTLIDCVAQTLESWRQTLSEFGHTFTRDELQPYSGMDGAEMLDCLLPKLSDDKKKQVLKQQGELFRAQYLRRVQPFPEVHETFEALRNRGVILAIATTCKHDELAAYDEQMQVLGLTDAVACGDDVKRGKPHPDLFRLALRKLRIADLSGVLAIGDTPYDARAATALGLGSIGVLTGGFSRAALQEAGCIALLDQGRHIVPYLASRDDVLERVLDDS